MSELFTDTTPTYVQDVCKSTNDNIIYGPPFEPAWVLNIAIGDKQFVSTMYTLLENRG